MSERRAAERPSKRIRRVVAAPLAPLRFAFRTRRDRIAVAVLLVAGAYVYYVDLGGFTLQSYDEAIYANLARGLIRGGPWIVPRVDWAADGAVVSEMPFLQKPPGAFWLEALSMLAFGATEFGARFPSATFAVATGVLAYVFGRDVFDRRAGFVAGLVWLTTPQVFAGMNGGRNGGTDTALVFFGTLFVYLVWKGVAEDRRFLAYAGLPAAGALLVKGPAAGTYPLALVPLVAADLAGRRRLLSRAAAVGAATTVALALPWALLAWGRYGDLFVEEYLIKHVLDRAGGSFGPAREATFGFMAYPYFRRLPSYFDPWIYFLLPAVVATAVVAVRSRGADRRPGRDPLRDALFLAWWFGAVLGFYAVTGNQAWYVLPIYVPAGLLIGRLVSLAASARGADRALARAGLLAGGALALTVTYRLDVRPLVEYRLQASVPGGIAFALALGAAVAVLVAEPRLDAALRRRLPSPDASRVRTAAFVLLSLLVVATVATPVSMGGSDLQRQQEAVGALIDEQAPPDATVYVVPESTRAGGFHALAFYADRPIEPATPERLASGGEGEAAYLFARAGDISGLDREVRVVGTVRADGETYVLLELAPVASSERVAARHPPKNEARGTSGTG
ncbi:ArnT family glycosyltransferase [Salinilacihabitans rarus]|uniref:ArnT family glycosyltransferase n=1 Tax=Salinilacihabitans rarus TaxID=2961596 RepID=UPI0020C8FFF9|nr:glycosyltransferase family 39 protein [Salinilacihabitans rarus]